MKMLNHRNNYTDYLNKERSSSKFGSAEIFIWHICGSPSNILAWCNWVRKRREWGRKVIWGTVSQAGARTWWSFPRGRCWWRLGTENQNRSRCSSNVCIATFPLNKVAGIAGLECSARIAYPMSNSQICINSGSLFPRRQEALCSGVSCSAFRAEA